MNRICPLFSLPRLASFLMLASVLIAVLLRTAIPAGYMLSQQDNGVFAMVICTGTGEQTIWLDQDLQPVDTPSDMAHEPVSPHDDNANALCDFAINTAYTDVTDTIYIDDTAILYGATSLPAEITFAQHIIFLGNHASRAPPFFYV